MSSSQESPYSLRMPEEMRLALTKEANKQKRSLNAEIVERLERSLQAEKLIRHRRKKDTDGDLQAVLKRLDEIHALLTSDSLSTNLLKGLVQQLGKITR